MKVIVRTLPALGTGTVRVSNKNLHEAVELLAGLAYAMGKPIASDANFRACAEFNYFPKEGAQVRVTVDGTTVKTLREYQRACMI